MSYIKYPERTTNKDNPSGYPSLDAMGMIPTAELGVGGAGTSVYLRGDRSWAAAVASVLPIVTKTGAIQYSANIATDYVILGDCTSGVVEIDLPDASANAGKVFVLKKLDSTGNVLLYVANPGAYIDLDPSGNLTGQSDSITIVADSSGNWNII